MKILSIGQMAKLNSVSEKALRIYHKEGLLIPRYVDEQTGYRYYTIQQSAVLDMILQMKEIGLSLNTIKEIIRTQDIDFLKSVMEQHIAGLEKKIHTLLRANKTSEQILEQCHLCKNKPEVMKITVEEYPIRRKLCFRIHSYSVAQEVDPAITALEAWENNLRKVKQQFLARGLPLTLFRNIGCIVSKQDLLERRVCFQEAFVFLDDNMGIEPDAALPAGRFVCMYCDGMTAPDGSYIEESAILEMLDYIEAHNLTIAGDYHGEVLAETPAFHYTDREMFVKLQIPVA